MAVPLHTIKKWALRLFIWLVVLPGIPFVVGSVAMLLYANWPASVENIHYQSIKPSTHTLTIVTHGMNDNAQSWANAMAEAINHSTKTGYQAIAIDWQPYAKDMLRCSRNASVIGQNLADSITQQYPNIKQVHFIAHSAGSFMAYGFCQRAKQQNPAIQIHNTYLDPVSVFRGIDWDYGENHFGRCADFAETYINVGDGVPGSNVPLANTFTFDITALKPKDYSNSGHLWPVDYYQEKVNQQQIQTLFNSPRLPAMFVKGDSLTLDKPAAQ